MKSLCNVFYNNFFNLSTSRAYPYGHASTLAGCVHGGVGGSKYKTIWLDSASYFGPLFEVEFPDRPKTILLQLIGKRVLPSLMGQNKLKLNSDKPCSRKWNILLLIKIISLSTSRAHQFIHASRQRVVYTGGGGGLSIKQIGRILRIILDPILSINSRRALKPYSCNW